MIYAGDRPDRPSAEFWRLIDLGRSDPPAAAAAVAAMSREQLIEFYWVCDAAAEQLRDLPFDDESRLPSEDGVDDALFWTVAQGEAHYRATLSRERSLPNDPGAFNDLAGAVVARYEDTYHEALPYPGDPS